MASEDLNLFPPGLRGRVRKWWAHTHTAFRVPKDQIAGLIPVRLYPLIFTFSPGYPGGVDGKLFISLFCKLKLELS